MLILIVSSCTS